MTSVHDDRDRPGEATARRGRRRRIAFAVVAALALGAAATSVALSFTGVAASGPSTLQPSARTGAGSSTPSPAAPASSAQPSPTAGVPGPTPSGVPSTASPGAAQATSSDPGAWVIGFDGVGPFVLGSSLAGAADVAPGLTDVTAPTCVVGERSLQAPDGLGVLLEAWGASEPAPVTVITLSAPGSAVTPAGTPRTAEGIGIGATSQQLLAAYPGAEQLGVDDGGDPEFGRTNGSGTWMVFLVSQGRVSEIQVGSRVGIPEERCPG